MSSGKKFLENSNLYFEINNTEASQVIGGSGCTLLRPLGWNRNGAACVEFYLQPGGDPVEHPMEDGSTFTGYSSLFVSGSITVKCENGRIKTIRESCTRGAANPF